MELFVYILFTIGKTCVAGGNTFFVVASAFFYFLFPFCCFVYFRNYAVRIYLYKQYGIYLIVFCNENTLNEAFFFYYLFIFHYY